VLDMLSEAGMLGYKAADAPMKANVKLLPDQGVILMTLRGIISYRVS